MKRLLLAAGSAAWAHGSFTPEWVEGGRPEGRQAIANATSTRPIQARTFG